MTEAIRDIITLNKKIKDGHDNETISYKNYSDTVKPQIEDFKIKYGESPNKYLKRYLSSIFKLLPEGFELKNYQHYGNNKLHEFVWACIHFKYPNIERLYASSSPQLYVLVHSNGLKFGIDYGAQITNENLMVSNVKQSTIIQDLIIDACKIVNPYKLSQGADYLPQIEDMIKLNSRKDIIDKWDSSVHLIKHYSSDSIPNDLGDEIVDSLEKLKPLFQELCALGIEVVNTGEPISKPVLVIPFNILKFKNDLKNSGLFYSNYLPICFTASLLSKPFLILTGLSGSGKTKLAQAFAQWICQDESQYSIIPVGADWTNREPLLGYPNALESDEYVKPDNNALDLIMQANIHPELPYFLILDEMNLSHVERYFADFLSVMESKERIILYDESNDICGIPSNLEIPSNLFIIGTVNIDETTNMFSPKVLDRANTIEFRVTSREMEGFLNNIKEINMAALNTKGAGMAKSFLQLAANKSFAIEHLETINKTLLRFFGELKKTGAEFGYRSAAEILRLIHQLTVLDDTLSVNEKIDIAIMQKLLPKLHGSRRKLCPVLITLAALCLEGDAKIEEDVFDNDEFNFEDDTVLYLLSLEKIKRMYKGAIDNGFASFAEA